MSTVVMALVSLLQAFCQKWACKMVISYKKCATKFNENDKVPWHFAKVTTFLHEYFTLASAKNINEENVGGGGMVFKRFSLLYKWS
jgi:hypothetical protein